MTSDEYFAIVHKLRLTPTRIPTVWKDDEGCPRSVPLPYGMESEQIRETAERVILLLGRSLSEFGLD
jgi:hypothetical protein